MKLRQWLANRDPSYVAERAGHVLRRYGVSPSKAMRRAERCVALLDGHGCPPTFPTPGSVVHRYPNFIRQLQAAGAELAVHSYDHVDLAAYPLPDALRQLSRAAEVFAQNGVAAHGFRCPYLSCPDALLDSLPKGLFHYSSNQAIAWPVNAADDGGAASAMFQVLDGFYTPTAAAERVSVPWTRGDMIEIPVSLPDDLQLHDGLGLGPEGLAQTWRQVLLQTHARGELLVLLFHPELAERCEPAFVEVLNQAKRLQPPVWCARLHEIAAWWREKAGFAATVTEDPAGLQVAFACSPRATILIRGLAVEDAGQPWDSVYWSWSKQAIACPASPRPLVGLATNAPASIVRFLCEQGYLLEVGDLAPRCAVYLDSATLARLDSEVKLVNFIETTPGPLIRYGRWPHGARSALCVSGDLDALSLLEYASRLVVR